VRGLFPSICPSKLSVTIHLLSVQLLVTIILGTGIAQPADVGQQRPVKHRLRQETTNFMVAQHMAQMSEGISPEHVKFVTSLPVLRDASVGAISRVYDWLNSPDGHEITRRAWANCKVRNCSLLGEYLTSKEAKGHLRQYLATHKNLRDEIENKIGKVYNDLDHDNPAADDANANQIPHWDKDDHADVPARAVVRDTLGIDLPNLRDAEGSICVEHDSVTPSALSGELRVSGETEEIWLEGDSGDEDSDGEDSEL
jgi:hypothetical protein